MGKYKTIYTEVAEVEVEVSLDEFDLEDLIEEVEASGYKVIETNDDVTLSNSEYQTLRNFLLDNLKDDALKYPWSRILEKLEITQI